MGLVEREPDPGEGVLRDADIGMDGDPFRSEPLQDPVAYAVEEGIAGGQHRDLQPLGQRTLHLPSQPGKVTGDRYLQLPPSPPGRQMTPSTHEAVGTLYEAGYVGGDMPWGHAQPDDMYPLFCRHTYNLTNGAPS